MSVFDSLGQMFRRNDRAATPDSRLAAGGRATQAAGPQSALYGGDDFNSIQGDSGMLSQPGLAPVRVQNTVVLPLLGRASIQVQQQRLFILLALAVLVFVLLLAWVSQQNSRTTQQLGVTAQALAQSQRLAKAAMLAASGQADAFAQAQDSADQLARNVRALQNGDSDLGISALGGDFAPELSAAVPLAERSERHAATLLGQQKVLQQAGVAQQALNRDSGALLQAVQAVRGGNEGATLQLQLLMQRVGKAVNEFQTLGGASEPVLVQLSQDLRAFKDVAQALVDGAAREPQLRQATQDLAKRYEAFLSYAMAFAGQQPGLLAARNAQAGLLADSEPLRRQLLSLETKLSAQAGIGLGELLALVLAGLMALLCGMGFARVQLLDSRSRQTAAEGLQVDAKRQEQDAKRVNDANQAAILRLMNELQSVAEGDLTQQATVTEDITGAIADSVNYTVEELRVLVGSVQNTASRVAQTTEQVDNTSTELLATSTEQLREIRETGRSVLEMATRITEVSGQAQESAQVARQSVQAADQGLTAVQNAIGGMNAIRDQIQDTSKRIKRLGESSQEIGEITELISDITEQTNVLALNAAIQAASAGEAGRGFSVVAEEVQRLAERSADATRQIASLVKAIQTDTQDAVAAMERSTQGVVEGARLSDSAGAALSEIDRVSRSLAQLIEQISTSASSEAALATVVAENIQHIFAVTEQTGEGTRSTAQQVRELSHMAEELRQSVARFKIA